MPNFTHAVVWPGGRRHVCSDLAHTQVDAVGSHVGVTVAGRPPRLAVSV